MDKKAPKLSKAEKQYQSNLNKALKQSYEAGTQFLAGQEQRLTGLQPQIEQQIAQTYESQAPEIQRLAEQQRVAIAGQQEQTRQQRESALAQARRQYQEGTQRTQQLFGGVAGSSAGQAQSDILAREQSRQMGQTQMATAQTLGQLASNLQNVEVQTANQLNQLQVDKQRALTQARDQFRQQLDAINSQRFQLAQDKSNKQIQALQDFNTRRRQLEDFYSQQEANLNQYRAQQPIALATYEKQLQLAQKYPAPGTGSSVSVPNLSEYGYNNQARLGAINQILTLSDTDLRKAGYRREIMPTGTENRQVIIGGSGDIYDVYTGERIK